MQSQHQRRYLRRSTRILHLEVLEDRHLLSTYTITDLGSFGADSWGYAVNDAGMVVGESQSMRFGDLHAFLWDAASGMQDLGTLGGSDSAAYGINSEGSVVGRALDPGGHQHAFLYDGGPLIDLGTLGGRASWARGVNNAGQVVGFSYTADSREGTHAFLWDAERGMRDLGILPGPVSDASAINDSGRVVGFSYATGGVHAFIWDSDKGMRDLGTLGGALSFAAAINAQGHIVGGAQRADGYEVAFFYDGKQMIDIGQPSPSYSVAEAINDSDQIVGTKQVQAVISDHGFVYADGEIQDLNDLIPPNSGFIVSSARGINNAGQIVGIAWDARNQQHAVLLTPQDSLSPRHPDVGVFRLLVASTEPERVDTSSVRQPSPTPGEHVLKAALSQVGPAPRQAADVVFSGDKFSANRYVTAPLSLESDWLPLPE